MNLLKSFLMIALCSAAGVKANADSQTLLPDQVYRATHPKEFTSAYRKFHSIDFIHHGDFKNDVAKKWLRYEDTVSKLKQSSYREFKVAKAYIDRFNWRGDIRQVLQSFHFIFDVKYRKVGQSTLNTATMVIEFKEVGNEKSIKMLEHSSDADDLMITVMNEVATTFLNQPEDPYFLLSLHRDFVRYSEYGDEIEVPDVDLDTPSGVGKSKLAAQYDCAKDLFTQTLLAYEYWQNILIKDIRTPNPENFLMHIKSNWLRDQLNLPKTNYFTFNLTGIQNNKYNGRIYIKFFDPKPNWKTDFYDPSVTNKVLCALDSDGPARGDSALELRANKDEIAFATSENWIWIYAQTLEDSSN